MKSIVKEQFVEEDNYPKNILHIFAEKAPVKAHYELMLAHLNAPITSTEAIYEV